MTVKTAVFLKRNFQVNFFVFFVVSFLGLILFYGLVSGQKHLARTVVASFSSISPLFQCFIVQVLLYLLKVTSATVLFHAITF